MMTTATRMGVLDIIDHGETHSTPQWLNERTDGVATMVTVATKGTRGKRQQMPQHTTRRLGTSQGGFGRARCTIGTVLSWHNTRGKHVEAHTEHMSGSHV